LFNIEMHGFEFSVHSVELVVIGGLVMPLLASWWPIWRGSSLSVRRAIASYGLGSDFVSSRFDRWLEACFFSRLPTLYAVSLGNLFRRKARLFWTQSVLIIAGVLFIVIMSLIRSVNVTLDNELARSRYAVRLGFSIDQPSTLVKDLVLTVPQTKSVELWSRQPVELTKNEKLLRQTGSLGAQLVSLPANSTMYKPLITAGRWIDIRDKDQKVLVLNAETAELNGISPGDFININLSGTLSDNWQVIGLYRWFAGAGYAVEPIYAPLDIIQALSHRSGVCSFALIASDVNTLEQEKKLADALKGKFQDRHIKLDFYTTNATLEQRQFAKNQFRPSTSMLMGLASMIAAVGIIGLSGTLAISVLQRTREIGVFRALGASSGSIFRLFILEGFFHGLIAWLISVPIAYAVANPLSRKLGEIMLGIELDFSFSFISVWIWLSLVIVMVMLAAYFPARQATRIVVRSSLSY